MPDNRLELEGGSAREPLDEVRLREWLGSLPLPTGRCLIASVQRVKLGQLLDALARCPAIEHSIPPYVLRSDDLPITVHTDLPEQVGLDRLLNGVSANYLRHPERAAIIVDAGSAITVDRVGVNGTFEGGAILPGLAMSADALQTGTDLLPQIFPAQTSSPPAALGKSTSAALAAGLYWGAVGAVREIVQQQTVQGELPCELFITGGDGLQIAAALRNQERPIRYQQQMVLAGIWLAGQELQ